MSKFTAKSKCKSKKETRQKETERDLGRSKVGRKAGDLSLLHTKHQTHKNKGEIKWHRQFIGTSQVSGHRGSAGAATRLFSWRVLTYGRDTRVKGQGASDMGVVHDLLAKAKSWRKGGICSHVIDIRKGQDMV
jgi:hypothetical protein